MHCGKIRRIFTETNKPKAMKTIEPTTEQIERCKRISERSGMPFEKVLFDIMKRECGWVKMSKGDIKKLNFNTLVEKSNPTMTHYEMLHKNQMRNLPSSLR